MNLRDLNTELIEKGGFSYSLTFGDMTGTQNYSSGWTKTTEKVFDRLPTETDYREYVNDHITLLAHEDFVLGGWEHEGKFYLDVAKLLPKDKHTKVEAIAYGVERQQLAIYDLETGDTIDSDTCFKCGAPVNLEDTYCNNCLS